MTVDQEERPKDILSITTSKYAIAEIQTNFISGLIDDDSEENAEFGIEITQDGTLIGLTAGTTWKPDDGPILNTYHGLTPDQAREIAFALEGAADRAEAVAEQDADDSDGESFLRRLIG